MAIRNSHKLPTLFWAGFSMGKIDLDPYWNGQSWYGVLYTNKREADKHYQDVRRVVVREVKGARAQSEAKNG